MTEADLIEASELKGCEDGQRADYFRPLIARGISSDADDAYISAYFHALAYAGNPLA